MLMVVIGSEAGSGEDMPLTTAGWRARQHRAFALELSAGHLASWMLDPASNPLGAHHSPGPEGSQPAPAVAGCGRRSPR
jgi:hypothetical protein